MPLAGVVSATNVLNLVCDLPAGGAGTLVSISTF